ncbi:MAG: DAK2 domain-containing protein [bacterium]
MAETIHSEAVVAAFKRVSQALIDNSTFLTSLDQAMGDGDMGINMERIGTALQEYIGATAIEDIGKYFAGAGMATNRAAPSTMGTLMATAIMRAGKEVMGKTELTAADLAAMLKAAFTGMQERGKAQLGNKTILDALYPASMAFDAAVNEGKSLQEAGTLALAAAEEGRDKVTPLRSQIGRAGWVGERTEGLVDPGCAALVTIFTALVS